METHHSGAIYSSTLALLGAFEAEIGDGSRLFSTQQETRLEMHPFPHIFASTQTTYYQCRKLGIPVVL